MEWDLGDFTLTSITGYSGYSFDELSDVDFTDLRFIQQDIEQDFDQYSQELRLTSPLGERFEYIVGAYWQDQELDNKGRIDFDLAEAGVANLPSTALSTYRVFEQDAETWALLAVAARQTGDDEVLAQASDRAEDLGVELGPLRPE